MGGRQRKGRKLKGGGGDAGWRGNGWGDGGWGSLKGWCKKGEIGKKRVQGKGAAISNGVNRIGLFSFDFAHALSPAHPTSPLYGLILSTLTPFSTFSISPPSSSLHPSSLPLPSPFRFSFSISLISHLSPVLHPPPFSLPLPFPCFPSVAPPPSPSLFSLSPYHPLPLSVTLDRSLTHIFAPMYAHRRRDSGTHADSYPILSHLWTEQIWTRLTIFSRVKTTLSITNLFVLQRKVQILKKVVTWLLVSVYFLKVFQLRSCWKWSTRSRHGVLCFYRTVQN